MGAQDWVTLGEAARRAGVDSDTVRGWASEGLVRIKLVQDPKSYRLGYRVALPDVERVVKEPGEEKKKTTGAPASPEFQALLVRIAHVQESLNEQVRAIASVDARLRFEVDELRRELGALRERVSALEQEKE